MRSICTALLVLGLVGCANTKEDPMVPSSQPTSRPATTALDLPEGETRGAGLMLTNVTPFTEVAAKPESYAGKPILVSAKVQDVCKKKGCWMILTDGDHKMRVRFKDYGFFGPTDCDGQTAFVEGLVNVTVTSVDDLRHYAEESGEQIDPASITEPKVETLFMATGAHVVQ
ncbi:MAG: DUF4920 domain-containing protein [Planctomycetota bacterium]